MGVDSVKIIDGVIGSDDVYDLNTIDYRVSGNFLDIPYATYGQISGSSFSNSVGLFGLESWGSLEDSNKFESFRVFTELSSTTCGITVVKASTDAPIKMINILPHIIVMEVILATPLDGDSLAMSLGGMLIIDDTQLYKSTLAIGRINRGSDTGYLFTKID